MFTPEKEQEYANTMGLGCPYCDSANITATTPFEEDCGSAWREVNCLDCEKSWREVFILTGIEELE
jgi:hypothetical protein